MNHLLQVLVPLLSGVISFGIARYFHIEVRLSILLGVAVSGVTFCVKFISGALDFVRKALETRKLKLEVDKLSREAQEAKQRETDKGSLVKVATPEEISRFGVSTVERKLAIYWQLIEEKERLEVKNFVNSLYEKRE